MHRNKIKPTAVFLVAIIYSASGREQFRSRELKLECPFDEFNDIWNKEERVEGRFDAYSKGGTGRNLVEKMRKKPESYYQDVVDNVIMMLCDVEIAGERCVDVDSPFAAKDWTGANCIRAADYECPSGLCERSSNCYWNSVAEGKNRTTRFPIDAYKNSETELIGKSIKSYAGNVAQFGVIGTIISMLLLVFWVVFFIGRYLCCCLWIPCSSICFLCSPIPRADGYKTCKEVFIPILVYFISLVVIAAASGMAFVGNEDISVASELSSYLWGRY